MDRSNISQELVNVKCELAGEGKLTLHFDYELFVGNGKLFYNGDMKVLSRRSAHDRFKLMLETGFSAN